jgi:AAA domain
MQGLVHWPEDPMIEYKKRLLAAAKHYGIPREVIEANVFLDSADDQEFVIAREDKNGVIFVEPVIDSMIEAIQSNEIGYWIIDPFISSHMVNESDNPKIQAVAQKFRHIARETNSAGELIHHTKKGVIGREPTQDDARGASAFGGAVRNMRILSKMTQAEAEEAGIAERDRFFRINDVKYNMKVASGAATWRQQVSVDAGNSDRFGRTDSIGVVTHWKFPAKTPASVTTDQLVEVQNRIADGDWKKSDICDNWAGRAVADVMGLNADNRIDRAKIRTMLKNWLAIGALRVEMRKDDQYRDRPHIVVGNRLDDFDELAAKAKAKPSSAAS